MDGVGRPTKTDGRTNPYAIAITMLSESTPSTAVFDLLGMVVGEVERCSKESREPVAAQPHLCTSISEIIVLQKVSFAGLK